ncbi:unnamed protein product [Linum tenue]|uniref:Secreted protein n=1 Tax=Linum tenue TaxID=586396 RepID=A0AAV0LT92_9ROSI|nr:unnamed protein product [Linum tenue]
MRDVIHAFFIWILNLKMCCWTMVLFQKLQTLGCPNSIGLQELISGTLHQKCSQMAWEMFCADQTCIVSECCCLKWSKGNGWPNQRGNLLPKCTSPCGFMTT